VRAHGAGGHAMAVVTPLNPLSIPRGVKLVDELTGEPATLVAVLDGVSYHYATAESQKLDEMGILHRIGPVMGELATLTRATQGDRATQAKRIRALQEDLAAACEAVANHYLGAKQFERAIPAALRGLRARIALYGEGSLELVRAYLVLAEVNLGLNRTAQAEEFLSTCNYILVKATGPTATGPASAAAATGGSSGESTNRLRSRMHRNFGRLYAAQGNNAAALEAFARDIYYATLSLGPEHIDVSIGYFFMAQVFAAQARMEAVSD